MDKITPTKAKIKQYNSDPIPVYGVARCAVTLGMTSIPIEWHIISGSCEPIISGKASTQLDIIQFNSKPPAFQPLNMIENQNPEVKQSIQSILAQYPEVFTGVGKLRNHQVKLHVDQSVKPVNVPPRLVPYHLKDRVNKAIAEMIEHNIIEEHPPDQPAPWVSCAQIALKPNGDIRVTLDGRNVNKALLSTNIPIPRQEDIKAKLSGSKVFSKMDFKSQPFGKLN